MIKRVIELYNMLHMEKKIYKYVFSTILMQVYGTNVYFKLIINFNIYFNYE